MPGIITMDNVRVNFTIDGKQVEPSSPDEFDFIIAQSKHCAGDCTWLWSSSDVDWSIERRDCTLSIEICDCPKPDGFGQQGGETRNTACVPPGTTTTTTTAAPTTTTTTTQPPGSQPPAPSPAFCGDGPANLSIGFSCGTQGCCGTFQWEITSTGERSAPIDIRGSCADHIAALEAMPSVPQGCVERCAGQPPCGLNPGFSMCVCDEFPGRNSGFGYVNPAQVGPCGSSGPCPE